ncbi:MAG: sulfur carrier protein ThiS [Proteobacteria bacterium]|nr:sulfur carrier protein ThiS [Pseudomonadota bacterium]MCH9758928.1 sulfur carrier protein ThiS [Pseudomonadota bacterium]
METATFTVNGEVRACQGTLTVAALLVELALQQKKIAVEKNGTIIPKSQHATVPICPGDVLEIITAVGGG